MARTKLISSLVIVGVLAASVSTGALAGDRGHHGGVALAAGIIGGVILGSIIADSRPTYAAPQTYYEPQPVYTQPQQVYYQPQPVRQTYYAPAPYYRAQPVVYVDRDYYRERREHRHHHRDRDGYYSR